MGARGPKGVGAPPPPPPTPPAPPPRGGRGAPRGGPPPPPPPPATSPPSGTRPRSSCRRCSGRQSCTWPRSAVAVGWSQGRVGAQVGRGRVLGLALQRQLLTGCTASAEGRHRGRANECYTVLKRKADALRRPGNPKPKHPQPQRNRGSCPEAGAHVGQHGLHHPLLVHGQHADLHNKQRQRRQRQRSRGAPLRQPRAATICTTAQRKPWPPTAAADIRLARRAQVAPALLRRSHRPAGL